MKTLHEQIQGQIDEGNTSYMARSNKHQKPVVFNLGDLVWLYLRMERFPCGRKNILMALGEGSFKVLESIGDNAYKLEIPRDMNVSTTFNVGDLTPYVKDDDKDLRVNPS